MIGPSCRRPLAGHHPDHTCVRPAGHKGQCMTADWRRISTPSGLRWALVHLVGGGGGQVFRFRLVSERYWGRP